MLTAYYHDGGRLVARALEGKTKPVWIDLFDPTKDEELAAEKLLGISIPTREEMHEIEISSRLYTEDGTLYMTATLPEKADSQHPIMMPVTFILAKERLVTVRYHEPGAFSTYPQRAKQTDMACDNAESVLVGILEAVVDRLADVLEKASLDIVAIGQDIFHPDEKRTRPRGVGFQIILRKIGRKESLISNIQESLLTLQRVATYFDQAMRSRKTSASITSRIKTLSRDIRSLSDHATSLAQKIVFMLDATLGMIGIAQNDIIKIVSVAAVVFLPPTLIASIYGMNFELMPELKWLLGYPFALTLMVISAIVPAWIFRRLGWI